MTRRWRRTQEGTGHLPFNVVSMADVGRVVKGLGHAAGQLLAAHRGPYNASATSGTSLAGQVGLPPP